MTVLFRNNGKSGAGFTQKGTGTWSVSSGDQAFTGKYSHKFDSGAGNLQVSAYQSGMMADAGRRVSLRFRVETLPTGGIGIVSPRTTGDAGGITVRLNNNGRMEIANGGTQLSPQGAVTLIATGTWYLLTFAYAIVTTTNWSAKLWINGALELSRTNADATLTNTSATRFEIGWVTGNPGANRVLLIDDVYVDDDTSVTDPGAQPFLEGHPMLMGIG